jgi:transcriptional regulator with XRE-family HTH domain
MKKWTEARKRRRISQFELANKTGIARWRIAYAEAGYLRLEREEMEAVRRVLGPEGGSGAPRRELVGSAA